MKKTRSTTLRRAWPSSDFSDRASDRMRSRSEKDYRLHKHFPPAFIAQASRGYMTSAEAALLGRVCDTRLSLLLAVPGSPLSGPGAEVHGPGAEDKPGKQAPAPPSRNLSTQAVTQAHAAPSPILELVAA
ncbi:Storkhead-box protein 2 [Chelonia mydas]|uniref:Storkhead-box protein 2 n=1 Tax=Chelonia mydas TaxID=8469 RepID=M7CIR0_CHEMY|nr:Storkhead-box protein 2 [Chelonia mydas]